MFSSVLWYNPLCHPPSLPLYPCFIFLCIVIQNRIHSLFAFCYFLVCISIWIAKHQMEFITHLYFQLVWSRLIDTCPMLLMMIILREFRSEILSLVDVVVNFSHLEINGKYFIMAFRWNIMKTLRTIGNKLRGRGRDIF